VKLFKIVKVMRFVNYTIPNVFYNQVDKDATLFPDVQIYQIMFVTMPF